MFLNNFWFLFFIFKSKTEFERKFMYQYFLGIDISKDSFDFCFIVSNEKLLDRNHYLMSYDDFTNLGNMFYLLFLNHET